MLPTSLLTTQVGTTSLVGAERVKKKEWGWGGGRVQRRGGGEGGQQTRFTHNFCILPRSNYHFSGKETSCKDFGPATAVIVNNTCAGCVDNSKGQFSYYSMGIGGPANNFVPAMSYWAQPHPHGGGANTYDIPNGVASSNPTMLSPGGGGYVFMMQTHHW